MRASSARKLAQKNQTKVDIARADDIIAKIYDRVKTDATSGNYSSFIDIPKELDHESYHKYIIDNIKNEGYNIQIILVYDKNGNNRVYKVTWGDL